MSCDRLANMMQIAVEEPEKLREEPWLGHMEACENCRKELAGMEDSLAVFSQLENERWARCVVSPGWERLCAALVEQRPGPQSFRAPMLAAAVVAAFLVGAAGAWMVFQPGNEESPQLAGVTTQQTPSPPRTSIRKTDGNTAENESEKTGAWGDLRMTTDGRLEVVRQQEGLEGQRKNPVFSLEPESWQFLDAPLPPTMPVSSNQ